MDHADLLQHATRYRELAACATDRETREALLDLAAEYEALARELEHQASHDDTVP